ncbi:TetR/AcrR family transcriptional regulator [Catenulispora subtropica]|uniref:TetR/AcrR family transcriptional regulator n=1 Tax=Catenulispora subtropica TaxID=450798 RepID=A0ABN2TD53_9ACTN
MGRPPKFTEDQFLDAALHLIAEGGPDAATVGGVGEALGAPVGSVYHRFSSREELLAKLWLRTARRFQEGFVAALAAEEPDAAAVGAALHALRWPRLHLDEARVLLLYRREDLSTRWPADLSEQVAAVNAEGFDLLREHTLRRYGRAGEQDVRRVVFAIVDIPYAAGRRHLLAGEAPPEFLDELVADACLNALKR